jgi:hypothetical protein
MKNNLTFNLINFNKLREAVKNDVNQLIKRIDENSSVHELREVHLALIETKANFNRLIKPMFDADYVYYQLTDEPTSFWSEKTMNINDNLQVLNAVLGLFDEEDLDNLENTEILSIVASVGFYGEVAGLDGIDEKIRLIQHRIDQINQDRLENFPIQFGIGIRSEFFEDVKKLDLDDDLTMVVEAIEAEEVNHVSYGEVVRLFGLLKKKPEDYYIKTTNLAPIYDKVKSMIGSVVRNLDERILDSLSDERNFKLKLRIALLD